VPIPLHSYSGNTASTRTSPVSASPLQNPTNLESCEHSHPLIRPLATLLAMASAVIQSDASSSLEIGFSLVRARTEKSSSTSDGNVSRNISSMPLSTRYSADGSRSRGKNGNAVLSIILEDFSDCSMAVHSSRPSSGSGRLPPSPSSTPSPPRTRGGAGGRSPSPTPLSWLQAPCQAFSLAPRPAACATHMAPAARP
jgi:hypothetical protein